MISSESQPPSPPIPLGAEQIRANMNRVARRQWWLWSVGMMVSLLLTLGIASFAFPGLLSENESLDSFRLNLAVRGLVGLVLLFNVYTVYQQLLIHRLQGKVSDQVEALGKIEVRTEEVYNLAVLDSLTGLNNRRSGEQRLADEMSRAQRHGRPLTILLLDLDGLKSLNDKFGHAAGDELIRQFAARLKKAIRGSDLAVRLGGDEFLVLLPDCQSDEVRHVLGRLMGVNVDCKGHVIALSFSAGWAYFNPGESPEDIMKRADDALYVNKRAGRVHEKVEALSN
jgi:diguanylate cyclase (GGDEF)-like protein